MNSVDLLINLNKITKKTCVKSCYVISADEWSKVRFDNLPVAIIMHSENSNVRMFHFVAFFVGNRNSLKTLGGEMWDSYGNHISKYETKMPFRITNYNKNTLQCADSVVCSYHSLFFIYHKSRGKFLSDISKMFTQHCKSNDLMVYNFFKSINLCI